MEAELDVEAEEQAVAQEAFKESMDMLRSIKSNQLVMTDSK